MKRLQVIFLLPAFILLGCDLRVREKELERRADSINQKEQQLLVLKNQLDLKSQALDTKEHVLDSLLKKTAPPDTALSQQLFLVGRWNVKMVCTETTCPGSAVGDNKTEIWDLSYQNNMVIAQAFVNNKMVRLYSGTATENELVLTAQQESESNGTNISANLRIINETTLEGERKIIRPDECRIIYSIQMEKIVTL
jgi:hypothetical protein